MLKKAKLLLLSLALGLLLTSSVSAGQAIRVGMGLPTGAFGEYEYKVSMDQIGLFANYGTLSGTVSALGGNSSDVKLTSWSVGARYYLFLGFHVKAALSSISADGSATDSVTSLSVDATAKATGLDIGIGQEIGIGPVFIGVDGGAIMAKPEITSNAPNELTGGILDTFDISMIPYVKAFLGFKF
jgi:hypothetical protein